MSGFEMEPAELGEVEPTGLKDGWECKSVAEVCVKVEKVKPGDDPEGRFTYIDISSIDRKEKSIVDAKTLLGKNAPSRARQEVRSGDILFSTVRPNLRTIAQVPIVHDGAVASTGFCVLRANQSIVLPGFLFLTILRDEFQSRVLSKARGVSYPAVRDRDIFAEKIALPSLEVQAQTVSSVLGIQTGADQIADELERVDELNWQFHQALLRDAFKGRLTGATQAPDPEVVDEEGRQVLPRGWEWRSLADLGKLVRGVTYKKPQASTEPGVGLVRLLRATNLSDQRHATISLSESLFVPEELINEEQLLRLGDILIVSSSGSRKVVGKSVMVGDGLDRSTFGAFCSVFRPNEDVWSPYLGWLFRGPSFRTAVSDMAAGSNINNLKRKDLLNYEVPIPVVHEQKAIAVSLDVCFSRMGQVESEVKAIREKLLDFRSSLLHTAFSGNPVTLPSAGVIETASVVPEAS